LLQINWRYTFEGINNC